MMILSIFNNKKKIADKIVHTASNGLISMGRILTNTPQLCNNNL